MANPNNVKNSYYIYGLNTVNLVSQKSKERILEVKAISKIAHNFKQFNCSIISPKDLNQQFPDVNHQGVVAKIAPKPFIALDNLISAHQEDKIVILDRITDIHNIGAIIRSALAFKINKFIIPKHDSCYDMAKIAKSSSGYSEIADIAIATNLTDVVTALKKAEYWCFGLDGLAKSEVSILKQYPKIALVLGNEHQGIRQGLRKNCDMLVKIPMTGEVESLNVSVAAALAFYSMN